jgi:hypothetical protein
MNKKGYLQISFAWLFAIIVGIFILFLAIYFSIRLIDQGQYEGDLKTGKNFLVLTNPLETGFETDKVNEISFPVKTRIYNRPDNTENYGIFGRQLIKISQLNFKKWTDTKGEVSVINKYLFSESPVEGKDFYLFSKPFEFPFKVADLIYIIPSEKNYCFKDAPEDIQDTIKILFKNEKIAYLEPECPENSIEVCFSAGNDCEIVVENTLVKKDGKYMKYSGEALMYAAIFSNPEVYETQLKRLIMRTGQLANLYNDKAGFVSGAGCNTNLNLLSLISKTKNFDSSGDIISMENMIEDLKFKNNVGCELW